MSEGTFTVQFEDGARKEFSVAETLRECGRGYELESNPIVRKKLHSGHWVDENYGLPRTLHELAEWVSARLDEVPEEHREAVTFAFSDDGYDESSISLSVYYDREETDAERSARLRKAAIGAWRDKMFARQQELAQLAALKAKYEGK